MAVRTGCYLGASLLQRGLLTASGSAARSWARYATPREGSNLDGDPNLSHYRHMSQAMAINAKKTLAAALRRKLSEERISVSAFARKIGTGRQSVRRLLDGRNTAITLNTMAKAADALDLELELSVKALPLAKLEGLARRYVAATDDKVAAKLEEQFLKGYYGRPAK